MQTIASKSDIDEQELVEMIIDGLNDHTNAIPYLFGANSITELVQRLDRYVRRRQQCHPAAMRPQSSVNKPKPPTQTPTNEADVRCYNCSQFGHYQSKCPKSKRPPNSCFVCAEVGHFHQDCPKKKFSAATITNTNIEEVVDAFQMPNSCIKQSIVPIATANKKKTNDKIPRRWKQ
ncbi:uncharacterized protein LOC142234299 [Haematobia irritans]|uniref:uncharacterized protein LOC142234299 n=1 Tax=Haematobia irritans TaxID=7368 RepID=UPI003F500E1C